LLRHKDSVPLFFASSGPLRPPVTAPDRRALLFNKRLKVVQK
jgi:hypothetical protein